LGFLYQIGEITRNLEKILSKLGNSTAGKMLLNTTKVNTFLGKYPGVLKVKTFFLSAIGFCVIPTLYAV